MPGAACSPCRNGAVPTQERSACRCPAGTVPVRGTTWEKGNLACEECPAGEQQATAGQATAAAAATHHLPAVLQAAELIVQTACVLLCS